MCKKMKSPIIKTLDYDASYVYKEGYPVYVKEGKFFSSDPGDVVVATTHTLEPVGKVVKEPMANDPKLGVLLTVKSSEIAGEEIYDEFTRDLKKLINRHSRESGSNTPDFILAGYLRRCLDNFDKTLGHRQICCGVDKEDLMESLKELKS
jgi:hypothetical protein